MLAPVALALVKVSVSCFTVCVCGGGCSQKVGVVYKLSGTPALNFFLHNVALTVVAQSPDGFSFTTESS